MLNTTILYLLWIADLLVLKGHVFRSSHVICLCILLFKATLRKKKGEYDLNVLDVSVYELPGR